MSHPACLERIAGHPSAVAALRRSLAGGNLAGAVLLAGREGVGKTALAHALAAAAACLSPRRDPFDACGECDSCRRAAAGTHPEIVLIAPAGDQTQIWQLWDRPGRPPGILQRTLCYAPTVGARRVYILERAETLNEAAANSLLKVLEEPPHYAHFVLLATSAARLLPTIVSRCQVLRLVPSPAQDVAKGLELLHGVESGAATVAAVLAEGRFGTALRLATDAAAREELDRLVGFAAGLPALQPLQALQAGEQMRRHAVSLKSLAGEPAAGASDPGEPGGRERAGRRQISTVLDVIAGVYRDLLALRLGGEAPIARAAGRADELAALAARREPRSWIRDIETIVSARRRVDQNASIGILTDWLAVRLVGARSE